MAHVVIGKLSLAFVNLDSDAGKRSEEAAPRGLARERYRQWFTTSATILQTFTVVTAPRHFFSACSINADGGEY